VLEQLSNRTDVGLEEHHVALASLRTAVLLGVARHPSPTQHCIAWAQPFPVREEQTDTAGEMVRGVATQRDDGGGFNPGAQDHDRIRRGAVAGVTLRLVVTQSCGQFCRDVQAALLVR